MTRSLGTRLALVLALLGAGFLLQLHFFANYPQPPLFGDPAEYATLGHRLHRAAERAVHHPKAALGAIRGSLYMIGVSSVFAVLDSLRPGDLTFARSMMAFFNTLSMLGAFALACELAGCFRGGILGLALAAFYPSFSVETGRLYPDPITATCFVWAAFLFARGVRKESRWTIAASGLVLSAGLLVRSQILDFMLLLMGSLLVLLLPFWVRRTRARSVVLAFALSLVPLTVSWLWIRHSVGKEVDPFVQLGNETFKPYYPYGFWQYLDTDGWIGPYRLKTEPYARALQAAAQSDTRLYRSFPAQLVFTSRYVLGRFKESVLLVLDNVYRLYDRPANDYKWDYPMAYPLQVVFQKTIVVLAAAGMALFVSGNPALLGAFLCPLAIGILHGLVFSWPRYNLTVMPILLGTAGATIERLIAEGRRDLLRWTLAGPFALVLGRALFNASPELSRVLGVLGWVLLVSVPFALFARPGRKLLLGGTWIGISVLILAHAVRNRVWHEYEVVVAPPVAGVQQEIHFSADALARLRAAREAFLVFDLVVPGGDPRGVRVRVGDREFTDLRPTMPHLPESTTSGGRDPRGYPQWWAVPLDPDLIPLTSGEPLKVSLSSKEIPLILKADHFAGQDRFYEGPSFGDWPHEVDLKLEYDGDYRLGIHLPLHSEATTSRILKQDGSSTTETGVLRIRVIALGTDEGLTEWESAATPGKAALGFVAYSGRTGSGELNLGAQGLTEFPLSPAGDYSTTAAGFTLCYHSLDVGKGLVHGAYVLSGTFNGGRPAVLSTQFRTGMSLEPHFFIVDTRGDAAALAEAYAACRVSKELPHVQGATRVLSSARSVYPDTFRTWLRVALDRELLDDSAGTTFRWSVSEVF